MKSDSATDSKLLGMDIDSFVLALREKVQNGKLTAPEAQAKIFQGWLSCLRENIRKKLAEKAGGEPLPSGRASQLLGRTSFSEPEEIEETDLHNVLVLSYLIEDRVQHGEIHGAVNLMVEMVLQNTFIGIRPKISKLMDDTVSAHDKQRSDAGGKSTGTKWAKLGEAVQKRYDKLEIAGLDKKKAVDTIYDEREDIFTKVDFHPVRGLSKHAIRKWVNLPR